MDPRLTWNLVEDYRQLFEFPFMVNAFRAGTIVAVTAGLVGWLLVLRRQVFAGHTLALIGFPGASAAVLAGLPLQVGYFGFCVGGALVLATIPDRQTGPFRQEPTAIGVVQAFALGCGFLFASLYHGSVTRITSLLFGSFLGVTNRDVVTLAVVSALTVGVLAVVGRPLFFASVDADVALARGVRVRFLGAVFLVLVGVAAAEASQVTGSLLIFALLVLPPATAQVVTPRPAVGAALSAAVAVLVTWAALTAAYFSTYPIGFWTTTFAFATYIGARVVKAAG